MDGHSYAVSVCKDRTEISSGRLFGQVVSWYFKFAGFGDITAKDHAIGIGSRKQVQEWLVPRATAFIPSSKRAVDSNTAV